MLNQEKFAELTTGVIYNATFIPKSQSRNRDEKSPSLNWRIQLIRNGVSYETDYMMGIGRITERERSAMKQAVGYITSSGRKTLDEKRIANNMAETGQIIGIDNKIRLATIKPPKLESVVYCLLRDVDVLNHSSFEDWASNFGYDTDSRKACDIYHECLKTALKLKSMFGDVTLGEL